MSWGYYRPYVSAAEKRRRSEKAAGKLEKGGQKLYPIHIEGRAIARSFWGKSWCDNLESYSDYENRLPRGRTYVRNGSVLDIQITAGLITALVSGSELYRIKIVIAPVIARTWAALKTACAGRVGSLIDLLQGKLSAHVMEVITRHESGLFPKPAEIKLACSCPDWAGMCKHVAAALYGVGARLDESPELLFLLRGADHLELITEAAESITAGAAAPDSETIAAGDLAEVFGIEIDSSTAAPAVPSPKRAGKTKPAKATAGTAKTPKAGSRGKAKATPAPKPPLRRTAGKKKPEPARKTPA